MGAGEDMFVGSKKCVLVATSAIGMAMTLPAAGWAQAPARPVSAPSVSTADVDEVVVTGSRLITNGLNAPTPSTVLTNDALLTKAPTSIPDALKQLPQFISSGGVSTGVSGSALLAAGERGIGTYLNLRGLGNNRMLMLQDGHRLPPNTAAGLTNADLLPQLLIKRVDVVTGGVSAAYGSDGVSGVTNYIMDNDFTGLKAIAQGGISAYADMESYRVGLAAGKSLFDGRLHLMGSAERFHNDGVPRGAARPLAKYSVSGPYQQAGLSRYQGYGGKFGLIGPDGARAGTATNPYVIYPDERVLNTSFFGIGLAGSPLAGFSIQGNSLVRLNPGQLVTPSACINCPEMGTGTSPGDVTMVPTLTTTQYFGRADYDINDAVKAWAKVSYGKAQTFAWTAAGGTGNVTIFRENAYLPAAALAALGSQASFVYSTSFDRYTVEQTSYRIGPESLVGSAGLEGKYAGFDWDITLSRGRAETHFAARQREAARINAAVDAVRDPATGQIVCRVTLTNPGVYPGCAPMNVFGYNVMSREAAAYGMGTSTYHDQNDVKAAEANVRGKVFKLPAGDVAVAIGAAFRDEEYNLTTNSGQGTATTIGIRGLTGSPNTRFAASVEPSHGDRTVKEVYGEVFIPVAKDLPFVGSLDLDLAARRTDYSQIGGATTWKAGGSWQPVQDLRIRATLSRDIRAPSLGELYAGQTRQALQFADPHIGGIRIAPQILTGGNPDLRPEVAKTFTVGGVYKSSWIEGLSGSVDYFRIRLQNAIGAPYMNVELVQACEDSGGTDATLCSLITRPLPFSDRTPANAVTELRQFSINVAKIDVEGIDYEVAYDRPLFNGRLGARLFANYMLAYDVQSAPGRPVVSSVGYVVGTTPTPRLRGSFQLSYAQGPFKISLQERYIGRMKHSRPDQVNEVYEDNTLTEQGYTDINVTYDFTVNGWKVQAFANAQNVFNKLAELNPAAGASGGGPLASFPVSSGRLLYDTVGAVYATGVRVTF